MAAARPLIALISFIILCGGLVLQLFTILSGGVSSSPINKFYFLEASNIGSIPNARNPSRWTFFAICGVVNGRNGNCGKSVPALPFDPPRNFDTQTNVPQQFIGTHQYFYLSRFMFAFYLIALFFAAIAFFTAILAFCSRLGGYFTGLCTALALFFQTLAAALMTAWTVKGRNAFRSAGFSSKLGVYSFAFTWAAMACFFICTALFCFGGAIGRDKYSSKSGLGRKRSTRSTRSNHTRGSFIDTESQRRVKDDYS